LSASQIRPHSAHHFRLILWALLTHRIGLDILVQKLVRIQLRAVAGQVEQPNLFPALVYPMLGASGPMHRMAIHNQKHLPRILLDQPAKKLDHYLRRESLFEYHKGQSAPVGNRRYHVAAKPLASTWNHGRLPFAAVTASGLVIGSHPHFVAPVDFGTFGAGLPSDGWIVLFKPAFHSLRILFVGAAKWFLRGKAPSFQIPPNSPDRKRDAKPSGNQLSQASRPQAM